jgi:cholesterol oxidase
MFYQNQGRRRFLQNAAVFSTGLMASLANARISRANDQAVEALVIGSGFGGAVAALRLAQAGINTVILERGRRWRIEDPTTNSTFATFRNPDGRSAWLSPTTYDGKLVEVYAGILELKVANGISILAGSGVGGGSLVYNAVTYQPPRALFYRVLPPDINYDDMDKIYYPRVRQMQNAQPIPQDILNTSYYSGTRVFLKRAEVAGIPTKLVDIAADWNTIREEINGTKVPAAIIGEHWYGINSGAKNSVDRNYLVQAEQTGKVEILPLHIATTIEEVPGHGYRVSCTEIYDNGTVKATKTITCRYLFLAAGSIGTSELLVKAKATGTLPKLNNHIGQDWGGNGDTLSTSSGLPQPTNPGQGGPATAVIQFFDNPISPISLINFPIWDAPEGTITSLGMALPSVKGRFNYDASTGTVKLTWPENANRTKDPKVLEATKFAYKYIDVRNTVGNYKPTTETVFGSMPPRWKRSTVDINETTTAHPLGGAVLGKACDLYGRVLGYQGLYVVDGAMISGSTGCTNPALTIAALAERNMEHILKYDIS